ncbi:MAG TPA: glycosyltransferase family 4 protein [Solirubrobacteraceae bacterium]|jgi:glycosyltransferase involved in cell wall biosynthesis|nr:glycosyltransferase family 4 protein [Solirubrobacteraceae bacterium]
MLCDVDLDVPDATRTHSVEVARGFARAGLTVTLVARGADPELPDVAYCAADGAEHQKLRRLATINQRAVSVLWRNRASADRFYVRDNWSCFPAIAVARLLGYRTVVQVDGIPYGAAGGDGPRTLNLIKRLTAVATGRVTRGQLAVTPEIKRLLVKLTWAPEQRVAVIPNGVDLEFFTPQSREDALRRLGLDPKRRYLVFCGGFNPWSDFDTMLAAFAGVRAQRSDATLILVGDGPERSRIETTAERLGIADQVLITGMVDQRERVRDYLAAATITLLIYDPARVGATSASPIKLTEYLAMGRAVVAIEIPGLRPLVQDSGAGMLVPGEADAIAGAILELLEGDRADVCGAAGRRLAQARLSWQTVIERTLPLFGS